MLHLQYHWQVLLLNEFPVFSPEKSIKNPENPNYGNSGDSTSPTSSMPTFAVPCLAELGDDIPSTSKSIGMDGIHTLESDTRKYNTYPFIHDVNSLTWGICEDSYSQYEDKPFRELLFVVGNHGVTVHTFSQSCTYREEMGSTSEIDTGQGSWVEWGPGPPATLYQELDGQQEFGWHYDDSFNVFDKSRNNATEGRPYSMCTEATNDFPNENISEKRWLRTLLTKVETLKSDKVVYTRFPDNSLFDPSAMAVSFHLFHNDSVLLDFLSQGYSSSQEKDSTNLSILDSQNGTSAGSLPSTVGYYRCLRVFSNGSQCLIGFALTLTEFVPEGNERKNSKILVAVAKLLSWGLQWVFTVALDENVERHATAEWTDFRFSHAFLICLNASGLIYFYDAKNGLYVACLDLLHICGEQENLSVKIDGNCVEDKDHNQLYNKASNHVCQRRFERLFVILNALTLVVIDKHGVSYVIQATDYIPRKYHQLENLLPYNEDIGLGPLAAWEVGAADIGYQRDISGEGNTVTKKPSFTSNAQNKGVKKSPESNFKEAIAKNWCEFLGSKLPSGHVRKNFLPIYKFHEDDVICLSPFGITRLLKGRNSQDKSKCRLVHSSLHVDLSLNDDKNYNVQGWEAIVNEAIGCTFQGCLYLVTENGISVVLPSLSISSNFYPIEAIGYRQSGCLYGPECDFDTFAKIERVKKPLSSWKVEILDKVLLYEGPEQADQLCLENGKSLLN